jgi:hypothetical protein
MLLLNSARLQSNILYQLLWMSLLFQVVDTSEKKRQEIIMMQRVCRFG